MAKLVTSLISEDAIMVQLSYSYDGYSRMFIIFILMRSTVEVSYKERVFEICFRNSVPKDSQEIVILHLLYISAENDHEKYTGD